MLLKREIVTILGGTGSGKSELAKRRLLPAMGGSRVFILDRLGEYPFGVVSYSGRDFLESFRRSNVSGVYTLASVDDDDAALFFDACWHCGPLWAIVDECDNYAGSTHIMPELRKLVAYGRHRGVSMVCIARRPSEVHPSIRAQSDAVISFVQREPRDIKTLMDRSEVFQGVAELPRYNYITSGKTSILAGAKNP